MITLQSPVASPSLIGFTVNELTDNPVAKYVNASITEHYSDDSTKSRSFTLWMNRPAQGVEGEEGYVPADNAYDAAGQWTDADAQARIAAILAG